MDTHSTMTIYWSDEDECYLVSVSDLKEHIINWNSLTHGDTYEEAARMGTEAIEVALADETQLDLGEFIEKRLTPQLAKIEGE